MRVRGWSAICTAHPSYNPNTPYPVIPSPSRNLFRVNEATAKDPSTALRSAQDDREEGSVRCLTEERRSYRPADGRWPPLHPSDGRKGFLEQGKLSPEVTDELFIRSVRRTHSLSNKEKINRQLIRFLRNHLPLHGEGFRAARFGQMPVGDADHCVPRADVVIGPYTRLTGGQRIWYGTV